ncbi:MAG: hypothetical protein V1754_00470 [Pseudomonadota bacterium]
MNVIYRFRSDVLNIVEGQSGEHRHFLLEDPEKGIKHRLYELEYAIAQLFNGKRSVEEVARLAKEDTGLKTEPIDVDRFAQQLLVLGFVESV